MYKYLFKFLFFSAMTVFMGVSVSAQIDASTSSGRSRQEEPLPKSIQENLKKMEAEKIKKEYEEMLEYGKEAVKLSEEVEFSYDKNNKLTSADVTKLEKIEKLLKKVRGKLGGDDDDSDNNKDQNPGNIKNAISTLKESASNLFEELKKTSRFSISVVAIQSSNSLINIVRFLRFRQK